MFTFFLTDVTLRDGLQMEGKTVTTKKKLEIFKRLSTLPWSRIEITSFVNPKRMPQFKDAEKLCELLFAGAVDIETMAFVPNLQGMARFLQFPIPWVGTFISATETFNQRNVNATTAQALERISQVIEEAKHHQRKTRVYLSASFGCPYEGYVITERVLGVFKAIVDLNPDEIALSDTIGVATPKMIRDLVTEVSPLFPIERISLHLHNTYGLALSSLAEALRLGIRRFDGSLAGLGGCPYARGASGNIAIEEILYFLFREGFCKNYPWSDIRTALKTLSKCGLKPRGALSTLDKKGLTPFGVALA